MSVTASSWAWSQELAPTAKLLLLCLADHADEDGRCYPSQRYLAERCGVSDRTIRTQLSGLEKRGLLHREQRTRANGSRSSDSYQLHLRGSGVEESSRPPGNIFQAPWKPASAPPGSQLPPHKEPSVEPSEEPIPPPTPPGPRYTEAFEQWWSEYPRKTAKAAAYRAWKARMRQGVGVLELQAGLDRYRQHLEATGKLGTEYVMHGSTFLGPDRRWLDEYPANGRERFWDRFVNGGNGAAVRD